MNWLLRLLRLRRDEPVRYLVHHKMGSIKFDTGGVRTAPSREAFEAEIRRVAAFRSDMELQDLRGETLLWCPGETIRWEVL